MRVATARIVRSRASAVLGVVLLVASLGVGTAAGIVYGEPDGDGHPHVGSLVAAVPWEGETVLAQFCTGTLLDPAASKVDTAVFLTAAHCVFDLDRFFPGGTDIYVTFEPTIADTLAGGDFHGPLVFDPTQQSGHIFYHPSFGTQGMADLFDVAVILLDDAPELEEYGTLPEAGFLDALKQAGELKDGRFTTVGYGTTRDSKKKSFAAIIGNRDRNVAEQSATSLTKAWLSLAMNDRAVENGGTCYGDSGGPHFYGAGETATNIVVSLTVTGDVPCKASDKTYRMDTPSARGFLDAYVHLP